MEVIEEMVAAIEAMQRIKTPFRKPDYTGPRIDRKGRMIKQRAESVAYGVDPQTYVFKHGTAYRRVPKPHSELSGRQRKKARKAENKYVAGLVQMAVDAQEHKDGTCNAWCGHCYEEACKQDVAAD